MATPEGGPEGTSRPSAAPWLIAGALLTALRLVAILQERIAG